MPLWVKATFLLLLSGLNLVEFRKGYYCPVGP